MSMPRDHVSPESLRGVAEQLHAETTARVPSPQFDAAEALLGRPPGSAPEDWEAAAVLLEAVRTET